MAPFNRIAGSYMTNHNRAEPARIRREEMHGSTAVAALKNTEAGNRQFAAIQGYNDDIKAKINRGFGVGAEIKIGHMDKIFIIEEIDNKGGLVLRDKGGEIGSGKKTNFGIMRPDLVLVKADPKLTSV